MNVPAIDLSQSRILVVRLSAFGDVLRTLPAVGGLMRRFPRASMSWLVEDRSAALLHRVRGLDVLAMDRAETRSGNPLRAAREWRRVVREIKRREFDLAIDFHGVAKSGILTWLSRVRPRLGYEKGGSKEGNRWFMTHRLPMETTRISRYQRNLALARALEPGLEPWVPPLDFQDSELRRAVELTHDRPVILFPGTSMHGRNKKWRLKNWAYLFRILEACVPTIFCFGPDDAEDRNWLKAELGARFRALPSLSVIELAAVLRHVRLFVSCDTGPMHLAGLMNAPVFAMMGPSDPVLNRPYLPSAQMLVPSLPCAPCRYRECPVTICQDITTPHETARRVLAMLDHLGKGVAGA